MRALVRFVSLWGAGRRVIVHTELPIGITTVRLRGAASVATAGPFEYALPDPTGNHPLRGRMREDHFRLEAPRGRGPAFTGRIAVDPDGGTLVSGRMRLVPWLQVTDVTGLLLIIALVPLVVAVVLVPWNGFVLWWWGRVWLREDREIVSAVVEAVDGTVLRGA